MFIGNIPSELAALDTLHLLDVSNNNFSGSIPSIPLLGEVGSNNTLIWKNIVGLNVSGNPLLNGNVPDELCQSLNTTSLAFDCSNRLCGCKNICPCPVDGRNESS